MAMNVLRLSPSRESTDSENAKETKMKKFNRKEETDFNVCPFKLLWSFGINSVTPLINLTTKNRTIIAYACSHIVIIYNYETKEAINLQGHKNTVKTLSTSTDGKWLLSADFEDDCVVVVWDTETGTPICTLFNPHGDKEITAAKISPNAKYIVTVGDEFHQKVHFWLWTYGKDQPNAFVELIEFVSNKVKEIIFNEDCPEEFCLTANYSIVFFKWEQEELKYYIPQILGNVRRYGIFNCSCYINKTQRVLTATTNGYVLVWDISAERSRNKGKNQIAINNREHIKSVQLMNSSIMVILHHDRMIVTGSSDGRINFYDLNLRILYWCRHKFLDSVRSISFDLSSALLAPAFTASEFKYFYHSNVMHTNEIKNKSREKRIILHFTVDDEEEEEEEDFEYKEEMEKDLEIKLKDHICKEKGKYIKKIESMKYCEQVPSTMTVYLEETFKNDNKNQAFTKLPSAPTDATIQNVSFYTENFIISCSSGTVALIEVSTLKCRFIFQDSNFIVSSLDAHPRRNTPPLPDFRLLLDDQVKSGTIIYITCPERHEKLTAVTALKYSPIGDLIACGLENGTVWMLHPITLESLDKNPYKHSTQSILQFAFTECEEYMAYTDDTSVVAVFKKNRNSSSSHLWDFVGKYRDSKNVLYKYRLLNDITKIIRGTFLGPLYDAPVKHFKVSQSSNWIKVLTGKEYKTGKYMVFATNKEIGLQILPFDGNPYKILGMIGHPYKITNICLSYDGNILFTSGYNDLCVLMWKIKRRSVDVLAHFGGEGLAPYYCLIDGGEKGWLINEIKDLFYYAQILHQGENVIAPRVISDTVSTKEVPNLMRAVGYYPSNEEIEILMGEMSYRDYAETGHIIEEIKFEDFVKFYINHRPAFGISLHQIQEAFQTFANPNQISSQQEENPVLTREQFVKILFGEHPDEFSMENAVPFGEPLTIQEAFTYMKFLIGFEKNLNETYNQRNERKSIDFSFLPERISYKDFIADIMGIELPEETRADDN
ncbi:WD repeat-containing protein 66 [Melipona quadrifasciata]|uniref:Cilia- and flagella-associated protein 251 n=1 Tax=Melipona quadrifasciata TaxID=166423 RepID=A0A0N0BGX1_9HYME|nr:WD repeat-containing protein 66 [Melipona quadrifasciata]